jgi:circadian clock protein KaiB
LIAPLHPALGRSEDEPGTPGRLYELTLFVSGASARSGRAIANTRQLCDTHLEGRYHLSVVDVQVDPTALLDSGVLAVPSLVRNRPAPVRMIVGDLSDTGKVLLALDLPSPARR